MIWNYSLVIEAALPRCGNKARNEVHPTVKENIILGENIHK